MTHHIEDIKEISALLGPLAEEFAGRTVLLTGAAGFLGFGLTSLFQYLNEHRLKRPVRVLAFDNFISSAIGRDAWPNAPHIELRTGDISQNVEIAESVDFIIHAAGVASPVWYRTKPLETLDVSTRGTRTMLEIARNTRARMLHFSSSEVYGNPDPRHIPTSENFHGDVAFRGPRACYDEGKRLSETLCDIFHDQFGVHVVTVRPFNVYGPGMRERDYRVLPSFASRLKSGETLQVFGHGQQTRTFCYLVDALTGALLALLKGAPGDVYNIGNPRPEISMADLARLVCKISGKGTVNVIDYPDGYPSNEPMRRCPDIAKARLQLGFEPRVSLEDGLARFLAWTEKAYLGTQQAGRSA